MVKLIFFDFSFTLVEESGLNSGAKFIGKGDSYFQLRKKRERGEIEMEELITKTLAQWQGLKLKDLNKVFARFKFRKGVPKIMRSLEKRKIKKALVTNVPIQLAEVISKGLNIDYFVGTKMEVKNGVFTGKILEMSPNKGEAVKDICQKAKINLKNCVAVGDAPGDIPMFKKVGISVALTDSSKVAQQAADYVIRDFEELVGILSNS
jgi:phosphoserine phosphatase